MSTRVIDTRDELRVAVDPTFAPFAYEEKGGQMIGFDIDLKQGMEILGKNSHSVTPVDQRSDGFDPSA